MRKRTATLLASLGFATRVGLLLAGSSKTIRFVPVYQRLTRDFELQLNLWVGAMITVAKQDGQMMPEALLRLFFIQMLYKYWDKVEGYEMLTDSIPTHLRVPGYANTNANVHGLQMADGYIYYYIQHEPGQIVLLDKELIN